MDGRVVGVHRDGEHRFSKEAVPEVRLLAGLGVEGDAHCGSTVRHRSRVRADPTQPNLRQVHLIGDDLFAAVGEAGFAVAPGDLGENVTTTGLDLHALPVGAVLRLGDEALIALTGLRNPCAQIQRFRPGLLDQVRPWPGVMAVVVAGGVVRPDDPIAVSLPPGPPIALRRV